MHCEEDGIEKVLHAEWKLRGRDLRISRSWDVVIIITGELGTYFELSCRKLST